MKKFILSLLAVLFLSLVPSAKAQNTPVFLPYATTVNANLSGGQTYFYLLLNGGNVTTFSFTRNAGDPFNSMLVTVVFQQDNSGSRTVGVATNIKGTPTINTAGNSFTVVTYFYDVISGNWYAISASTAHS